MCVPICGNDVVALKPVSSTGGDKTDIQTKTTTVDSALCICSSLRSKACKHVSLGNSFMSNVALSESR